jgi:hypothetical protein
MIVLALAGLAKAETDTQPKDKTPPEIKSIDVKKGDQWVYEVRDSLTNEVKLSVSFTIADVSDTELDVRLRSKVVATNVEVSVLETYDRWWRKTEGPRATFKSNSPSFGIPEKLAVGQEWSYNYEQHGTHPPIAVFKWAGHGEVVAWEKIALTSGESYDAFKIEFHEASASSKFIDAGGPTKRFESTVFEWYAPSVNRYVKRTVESRQNGKIYDAATEQLIGYSRRDAD